MFMLKQKGRVYETAKYLENDSLWWESRIKVVQEWLRANPLRIGVPDDGTIEVQYVVRLLRLLKHSSTIHTAVNVVAELHGIPGVCTKFTGTLAPTLAGPVEVEPGDDQPCNNEGDALVSQDSDDRQLAFNATEEVSSPLRGKLRATKGKAPVVESVTVTSILNQQEEQKHPHMLEKKSLSQMSMMDRQQEWLRKKAEKTAAEKQRQQDEADKELTFQPTLKKSTRSLTQTAVPQPSTTPAPLEPTKQPRSKSADRHRKQPGTQKLPLKTTSSLLDSVKAELSASSAATPMPPTTATKQSAPLTCHPTTVVDSTNVDLIAKALESLGTIIKATNESPPEKEPPFQFDPRSSETKARYQLQDPAQFDLTSVYRKKDKYARHDGVSLQMGRRDDTREEQIIAVLFDREHFTSEAEAGEWFADHKQRLLSYMS
ncbi:hypothetical protein DYB26_007764 [Aphanomyces astaci]|uniref:Uncharacterized protein n=3 Tax=Aphanomyces astaci TaxID=112090 RepID=A0A397FDR3_APHAT|nr:hypothetical protein DYB38_009647 [Aphanomyces astaci]RHZ11005.1 hypothetical protein DYB26_007764 [Aphanomyces astaci]RHZ27276.1 hypothetical protein DYB31_009896 [Aphanomyces astaci]